MEESISSLSRSLGAFCNHLHCSCDALKQSVGRRPIPLRSASSPFIDGLNRRLSAASADLNLLDSMSFATVSLEELLGHCRQLFIKNQTHLVDLTDHLKAQGFVVPQTEVEDHDDLVDGQDTAAFGGCTDAENSVSKNWEEYSLLDETLSLKNFGLSDVCLATLASEEHDKSDQSGIFFSEKLNYNEHDVDSIKDAWEHGSGTHGVNRGEIQHEISEAPGSLIEVLKVDYENLPSYVKSLASWEDVLDAVEKINSSLGRKWKRSGSGYLNQEEIESLDLGSKKRAFVLLLVKMSRLAVETIDGQISYRVL